MAFFFLCVIYRWVCLKGGNLETSLLYQINIPDCNNDINSFFSDSDILADV